MLSIRNSFQISNISKLKGWEMIYHANINQKKAAVAISMSGKVEFKARKITGDKEEHYRKINGLGQIYGRTQISIRRLHGEPRNQQDG